MKKPKAYLVIADYDYEGYRVMKAFMFKADAEAFALRCRTYHATKPSAPPIEDTPENDEAHAKWWKALQRWEKRHPAKEENAGADTFRVIEVELVP